MFIKPLYAFKLVKFLMEKIFSRSKKRKNKLDTIISSTPIAIGKLQEGCFNLDKFSHSAYVGFDHTGYTICIELEKCCNHLQYFPESELFIATSKDLCCFSEKLDPIVENVSKALDISETEATDKLVNFFKTKTINVIPQGLSGKFYKSGYLAQTCLPSMYSVQVIAAAKTVGVSGIGILNSTPIFVIALSTIGAQFFAGVGIIASDNFVGRTCNVISWTLNRPMAGVELVLNNIVLFPITKVTGIPLLLNYTKVLSNGEGVDIRTIRQIAGKAKKKYGVRAFSWIAGKLGFNVTIN